MTDRNKGIIYKKPRAPAPHQASEVKDTSEKKRNDQKGNDSLKKKGKECPMEAEGKSCEAPPSGLNGCMGHNADESKKTTIDLYPEELNPFAGDSESDTNVGNTLGEKSIIGDDTGDTANSNADKMQGKKVDGIDLNCPKGLSPFADESDSREMDTPRSPQLCKSPSLRSPTPTPQPPPRRNPRARKLKRHNPCSSSSNKSTEDSGVPSDPTLTKDGREPGNVTTKDGKTVSETTLEGRQKKKQTAQAKSGDNTRDRYPEHLNPFVEDSDSDHSDSGTDKKETKTNTKEIASAINGSYPEHLNPFGEDSDSDHSDSGTDKKETMTNTKEITSATNGSYPEHLNPFGEDSESDNSEGRAAKNETVQKNTKEIFAANKDCYPEHLNPFGEDSDTEHEEDQAKKANDQTRTEDVPTGNEKAGAKGAAYPDELNPFSEMNEESVTLIDEENESRSDQANVRATEKVPVSKKRLGKVKRAVKSLRRLIGRLAACTRPQADSEI